MQSIQAEIEANNEKERHYVTHSADEIGLDIALRMSKTKLSFDIIRATAWQRRLICTFLPAPKVRHPPAKAGLKGVNRQDCLRQPPTIRRIIKKAVTPTPLKDIFTPIWAGPSVSERFFR